MAYMVLLYEYKKYKLTMMGFNGLIIITYHLSI